MLLDITGTDSLKPSPICAAAVRHSASLVMLRLPSPTQLCPLLMVGSCSIVYEHADGVGGEGNGSGGGRCQWG